MTPEQAYCKALQLGKRIPKLEPAISKDAQCSYFYARDVIKDRFILGEAVIIKNAQYSCWYARYVIKGRLPDFMHNALLLSNDKYAKQYIEFIE